MRRWLIPDSVASRTLAVMLLGLLASHLASMALYANDRASALFLTGGAHVAERIVTITQIVENAPAAQRESIARMASGDAMAVTFATTGALPPRPASDKGELLRSVLVEHFQKKPSGRLRAAFRHAGLSPDRAARPARSRADAGYFLAAVQLSDGTWLNFSVPLESSLPVVSMRAVLSFTVMLLGILILGWIVIRRVNRPLELFAAAAVRLGTDVGAPPLPVRGPREVRQATTAFNQMQERLRRFVEDRTRMLAAIAHDLRTPVTRLRLRAEFIEDAEVQQKTLADLDQMERMIASTLAFARDDAASEDRAAIDLASLLESVCADFADVGRRVECRSEEPACYTGRPAALRRALTNLVDNAVKYGEPVTVSLTVAQDMYLIRIEDNGPGVSEADLEAVFQPFYRSDPARDDPRGGSGLGLTVARDIIQAHGGQISLANRAQGGLRQEIRLPSGVDPDSR